jgi:hypothetical protein
MTDTRDIIAALRADLKACIRSNGKGTNGRRFAVAKANTRAQFALDVYARKSRFREDVSGARQVCRELALIAIDE